MPVMAKTVTYEYKPDELKQLIIEHLGLTKEKVEVVFEAQNVSNDYFDRGPGYPTFMGAKVTVKS